MLDFSNFPGNQNNTQIFYAQSGSNSWQTWRKPRGAKMIQIMCVGAGGSGATITGTGGGGGGGGGAITEALYLSTTLPDILFVKPGLGGKPFTAAAGGTAGESSYVSISPTTATAVCHAYGGSVGGTTSAGGSRPPGGNAGAVSTVANASYMSIAIFKSTTGGDGGAGGNVTTKNSVVSPADGISSISVPSSLCLTGGGGGGGNIGTIGIYNLGGSASISLPIFQDIKALTIDNSAGATGAYTITNPLVSGNSGGYIITPFFMSYGGAGGSAFSGGWTGYSKAGNGGYGSGGGGGGGRGTNQTGIGGDGGDGIIFITTIF